jgi:c-di-GMP-binding flagellar brake protein YcgR
VGDEKMSEKRRYKRSEIDVKVQMRRCDNPEHEEITVEVYDLSREGIGFYSDENIKIGEYYDAEIVIWTKEVLQVVLKIVRRKVLLDKDLMSYGAEFIGLSESEKFRIDVYQCVEDNVIRN